MRALIVVTAVLLHAAAVCALPPLDPNAATRESGSSLLWHDARQLTIEGVGFDDTPTSFSRLPTRAQADVTSTVWYLAAESAGVCLRFETDATTIGAVWQTDNVEGMNHMARSGSNGLDLYRRKGNAWEYCGTGRPQTTRTLATILRDGSGAMTEYLLYLPLYSRTVELKLGFPENATIRGSVPRAANDLPIVFYGTSITQGGCASRAGMCHVAMLGRWLDREAINLGFSGAGKGEPAMARLVAEIPAAMYVIESLPNMTFELVRDRLRPFISTIRERHSTTPIVLVENPILAADHQSNRELKKIHGELIAGGDKNIHYIPTDPQFAGMENGTVDGVHPTDLGFLRMALVYEPILRRALGMLPSDHADAAVGTTTSAVSSTLAPVLRSRRDGGASYSNIVVPMRLPEPARLAVIDLQRYLSQVNGARVLVIPEAGPISVPGRIIWLAIEADAHPELGEQGYILTESDMGARDIRVIANAPAGLVNGIYGLLRDFGFGFYLGHEAIPITLPQHLSKSTIVSTPALAIRGVLPWYNFFNSPTTWDPIDHRAFVDQLVRSRANFVGFHTYDYEPFAAYREDGEWKWGKRLLNTATSTWGTQPLRTAEFGFGISQLFADPHFGARTTFVADADGAIRAEQNVMRDALHYAHARGLKTCLGFEISGDPTLPRDREVLEKRLAHLLAQYPELDYIWLWQVEMVGLSGTRRDPSEELNGRIDPLLNYAVARREMFRRAADDANAEGQFKDADSKFARAVEGAKLEQYALLAHRFLAQRPGAPRLIISGWGGDERLLSAEYYEALDKLLPKDVVFASLDHIIPRTRVDRIYHELPPDRERWPIPWLEYDGDQWHRQPYVHVYEPMMRDVLRGGSQGVLGIHWRTRDIAENFAYMVEAAWDPDLSAKSFYERYASEFYPEEIAGRMAEIHKQLDEMGYRWVGGHGQTECGGFSWNPGETTKTKQLDALYDEMQTMLPRAGRRSAQLQHLLAEMNWTLQYTEAEEAARAAAGYVRDAHAATGEKRLELARKALDELQRGALGEAMRTYATRLTTRGEYGVLATVNTKAYASWRNIERQARELAGAEKENQQPEWNPEPQILLPRFVSSVEKDATLELQPIVLGGRTAFLHYRNSREAKWKSVELKPVKNWVQRAAIPPDAVRNPLIEFGFSFSKDPAQPMSFGPVFATVLPRPRSATPAQKKGHGVPRTDPAQLVARVTTSTTLPVTLEWNDLAGAEHYIVLRDGQWATDTAATLFPDSPARRTGSYEVEAWRGGKRIASSAPVQYEVRPRAISGATTATVRANRSRVMLSWPRCDDLSVKEYRISRVQSGSETPATDVGRISATHLAPHKFIDRPPDGDWTYSIAARSAAGDEAPPLSVAARFPGESVPPPVLEAPFTAQPNDARMDGKVEFTADGARFGDSHLVLPVRAAADLQNGIALEFEFRADSVQDMPVLLSAGLWQHDGWFVQILNGKLIIRTSDGDAVGPTIRTGKWYHVKWTYDGSEQTLLIDGKPVRQSRSTLSPASSPRELVIGNYEQREPRYQFHGLLRDLKIGTPK